MASWQVYRGEQGVDFTWDSQLYLVSPELIPATREPEGSTQEELNGCRAALGEAKQAGELAGRVCAMFMVFLGRRGGKVV